jgi:hypothetical protein
MRIQRKKARKVSQKWHKLHLKKKEGRGGEKGGEGKGKGEEAAAAKIWGYKNTALDCLQAP